MANAEPPGSTPSSTTHGSRKNEEKNVDDEEIFDPTDDEIIEKYLKKRVEGQLPPTNFIKEEDNAFTTSPAQLFQKYGMKMEDKGYFFSPLKENDEMKIATDGGFWKYRKNSELPVIDMNGSMKILGRTNFLDFFENNQADEELKTNWIMQEYSIQPNVPEAKNLNKVGDIVLCKILYDTEKKSETKVDNEDISAPVANEEIVAPTNEQIGRAALWNSPIDTDDAFISPVELFRRYGIRRDDVGLFYSPQKESFERRIPTDDGFWEYKNRMFTIPGVLIIRPLDYFEKNQAGEELKTKWVMEELSVSPSAPEADVGDIVLCEIQYDAPNLTTPGSRAEKVEEEEEAQGEGEAKKKKIKLEK